VNPEGTAEMVVDKGYHSNDSLVLLKDVEVRSYCSEPERGRRNWNGKEEEKAAVYSNRRRIRGERGKRLLRKRGELVERCFAHMYETGGMRRTHLRVHDNIIKRLLIHGGAFNLSLVMRKIAGRGTPRGFQRGYTTLFTSLFVTVCCICRIAVAHFLCPQRSEVTSRETLPPFRIPEVSLRLLPTHSSESCCTSGC
jgi:transposase